MLQLEWTMFLVENVSPIINVENQHYILSCIHMWMHTIFQLIFYNIDITLLSKLGDGFVSKERGYNFI